MSTTLDTLRLELAAARALMAAAERAARDAWENPARDPYQPTAWALYLGTTSMEVERRLEEINILEYVLPVSPTHLCAGDRVEVVAERSGLHPALTVGRRMTVLLTPSRTDNGVTFRVWDWPMQGRCKVLWFPYAYLAEALWEDIDEMRPDIQGGADEGMA